jgi:hypothetical protein
MPAGRAVPRESSPRGTAGATFRLAFSAWRRAGWPVAVVIAFACHALWQGHGVLDPAFRNPDVAGIAYNARLFASGLLPYVHSSEIKPPGAFYLFAPLLALGGMRAVWAGAVLWGLALSLATGGLARAVWGRDAGPRATVLHAACAAIASDADINYSFWMATPFTLSAACACAAATADARRAKQLWFASGVLSMLAVAIKPSAWPVGILFSALIAREVVGRRFERALAAVSFGALGAASMTLLLALPYLSSGRLGALGAGLDEVAAFGGEYVTVVRQALGGRTRAVLAGLPCLFEQMPGLLALAALGANELFSRRTAQAPLALGAWVFALGAFVGVSYTLRFFSHDNVQLWPALAVLAVRPAGLVARGLDRVGRWPRAVLPVTLGLGLLASWHGMTQRWGFVHYMAARDHQVDAICRELAPRLPASDPVLAWGWSAWSVYEHCSRRAPGRIFKVIATVTTVNTNTCNNGFGPMRLREGSASQQFLSELERRPPSLFLWSNYFKEMGDDPLDRFAALKAFIAARYTVVDSRGAFVAFLRNDLKDQGASSGIGGYGWSGRAGSVWTSTSRTPANPALMASMTQCVTR